ncbi:hypothetical protein LJ739_11530 [Aestuariibacter halophilus]|uniref:DUF4177 domain-containing protein n=1 Tax=Fluctibacter halophilus TaxID=226011 RepID=A0ABS8G8H2_9ALTE|nr:hypothetical protein [Aestuariibacter halophilus]MCC2616874.1 hypothetical protein [Aestuariibacter halophilus]
MNTIKYILFEGITSSDEADRLSIHLTQEYGRQGFELVSTTLTPEGNLLVGLLHKADNA